MKELIEIQNELKAPKGQTNAFGKYKYRSCEDIMEAVKPLLHKHKCCLIVSDEIVLIGDRYYIKATATITSEKEKSTSVSGYAREAAEKKGMDSSQITGATSSYARKYALNGLFAIDDTEDADATNNHGSEQKDNGQPMNLKEVVKQQGLDHAKFYEFMVITNAQEAQELFNNKQKLSDAIKAFKAKDNA